MKLECVTVCINYGDFLAETVKWNLPLYDRWVVVTAEEDTYTREVCRRAGLHCVLTHKHRRGNAPFNKGACVQLGLDQLAMDGWVLHADADIVLPSRTRHVLDWAHLDETCLYGCDRVMVRGWEQWQKLQASGWSQHDYHCRVNFPDGYPVGTRWATQQHGYCPIGFFQLWYGPGSFYNGIHVRPYPEHQQDAARSDVQFALTFDRRKRLLLPELIAVHLESEPAALGANWRGRTTKPFGPPGMHVPGSRSPS